MDELEILEERFRAHPSRHPSLTWDEVASALDSPKLASLAYMEETGGEPDAFAFEGRLYLVDFSHESPKRRSCCYDGKARAARKRNLPETGVQRLAEAYGIALVSEEMYLGLKAQSRRRDDSRWVLMREGREARSSAPGDRAAPSSAATEQAPAIPPAASGPALGWASTA